MNEIDPTIKTQRRTAVQQPSPRGKKDADPASTTPDKGDRVSLTKTTQVSASKTPGGSEIRHHLVNKFKSVLRSGSYKVKADEIADKMVQKIRDNKGPTIY